MMWFRRTATLAGAVALSLVMALPPAQGQEDTEALSRRVSELYAQAKYDEALQAAERLVEVVKVQHGENHPRYMEALSDLAHALRAVNRLAEAETHFRRVVAIGEAILGASHADLAIELRNLGDLLHATNRIDEAETLFRRALAIDEAHLGPDHARVGDDLAWIAQTLRTRGQFTEAEPLMRRALEIAEAKAGASHADTASRLNSLADLLLAQNRVPEAEPLFRRALAIDQANLGPDHPTVALRLGNLAQLLVARNALAEAEPMMRQALQILEARYGPNDETIASPLANLGALMIRTRRVSEAEPLMRRALAIDEAAFGPNHSRVAVHLNNLAELLKSKGDLDGAIALMKRALAIAEAVYGPTHSDVARALNNLGQLLAAQERYGEAEPLMRRAVAAEEANLGPSHPSAARYLNNLAILLSKTGRLSEAEPLLRRVVTAFEEGLGPDHPDVGAVYGNLFTILAQRGDWSAALHAIRRATVIYTADARRGAGGSSEAMRRLAQDYTAGYRFLALSLFKTQGATKAGIDESFIAAQRALASETASAVAEASARFAAGSGELAAIVRAGQDIARERAAWDEKLLAAYASADRPATEAARVEHSRLDARLDEISGRLARDFPNYAALTSPAPLTIQAAQALLKPNEVLVQFLDVPALAPVPETGFVWAITRTEARWARIPHGTIGLTGWVTVLRCGLDASAWTDAADWSEKTADEKDRKERQAWRRKYCVNLMGRDSKEGETPPFDLVRAHELYGFLFGQIEPLIKGKQLLIVPSGPLTGLPFHTLVTKKPAAAVPANVKDYARASWLGTQQAITVLPSAASLLALRKFAKTSKATQPFAGFGNPLLLGPDGNDNGAYAKQDCAQVADEQVASIGLRKARQPSVNLLRGGLANIGALRRQWPLPETADELCSVAKALGAPKDAVRLGQEATETQVKQLSASGGLGRARIVHFATHGLMAAETRMVGGAAAQPALMLTPPDAASEMDDGLLTAAEVTQLRLDADWVVLSACNTAAASDSGAEDLSGLARAFFYAGTRALLVSHWYVDNLAAAKLMTATFSTLKANPRIGRAEALRRAMAAMIAEGGGREHPAMWAPFVVVGEGNAPAPR